MKRLIVITAALAMLALSHAQLISVTQPTEPAADIVAESIVEGCNAALKDRCDRVKNLWEMLWENDRATPAQILTALGTNARKVFQAAALARTDLEAVATLANTTPAALLGDAKYLSPKYAVTFWPDGRATLTNP
jgi:hypothetical protein